MLRRERNVEFNLAWDLGAKFDLQTNGRTESVLVRMPPGAKWVYNQSPEAASPETKTLG